MTVPDIAVILVDDEGTAYLVVASPSSFYSNTKSHDKAKPTINSPRICSPVEGSKCGLNNEEIYDQVDHRTTCKRQKVVYSHEEDEAVVESAILARKGQLEKDAEQRAEIVFKRWCKEKKTLEQAIDETLRDHIEMCEKAHALRLQFEFEKSRWLAKIRENESESTFSRDTGSFPPAAERKKPYYTTDAIPEERNNTGESDEKNHQDMQNGHSNILTSENNQFIYDTSDEMLSVYQFDQDSFGVTQNLAVTMSDDDAADQNLKRKRKFATPSKSTVSADTSRPMESVTISTGIDVPVVTKNSMIDDIEQEQWQIDDNSGADFGATHYYEYQQAAQNEEFGSSAESAFPLTDGKTSFESVDVGSKYDADQVNNHHYDFETTDCDRELSSDANISQEFQDEYVKKNDDELLTLNMFVAGSPQRNYIKDSLAESSEIHLIETSNHRKNTNNENVATKYGRINKHGVGRAATQAGDYDTPIDGAHGSSQTGMQIDSLYSSSQSADTDTAAATMITGVDECRDDATATQAGDYDTPIDGAHGSSQTGMQIDSLYSSSQSADTDTAAATMINGIDECRGATQTGDNDTPVDGAYGSSQTGMQIDSLYPSSQSADTAAATMINGVDECRDDTAAMQAGDNETPVDGAYGSSQSGVQIDSLYLSSQSADTDAAAATMITGVDECRDDTTATQAGDNDTPVDGAHGSSHTGMQIDSLYLSSQSPDTDTAAAHISDGHLIAATASSFSSIDPIDLIDTDSLAVDGSVYLDDISDAVQSDRSPIINGIDECRSATQAGDDTPVDGAHGSSQSGMLIDSLYSSSQSADTAAAIMINGLDECRDDTTATQAGDYDTSVDGAHGSSQTGMQIDSLYSSSQSADTDTAAATMITGVDECRDDTTATQTGDNDTPVDGAYGSSHTGMLIDSLYLSSQSADTDTAAAHISDGHLIAASASIFNSIDPIDFIGNDSIAVDILLPT